MVRTKTNHHDQVLPLLEAWYISLSLLLSSHLLDQFVPNRIDLGLDALVALSCVLEVKWKVETQQVVQGAMIRNSVSFLCG